jgi:glycogen(starch) synthase
VTLRRVLMTADAVGGVWTFALELARALASRGVRTDLAVMGPPPSQAARREADRIVGLGLHEGDFRLEWMPDPWGSVERAGEWLLGLERRLAPDLIHLNGYVHGALPWSAPVVMTGHSCVRSWHRAVHGLPAGREWDRYTREVARGLRSALCAAAPTAAMLDALRAEYGPLPPSRVIPNGRSASRFRRGPKQARVLALGRLWDPAKNVAAVDRAAARLPWPVFVAGDAAGPSGAAAPLRHAAALGSLGSEAVARELAAASIVALPALYEPFGLCALEAGLSGCALVLGDIPSAREVWGDAALYVSPRDDAALADTLHRLILDSRLRRDAGRRALERALAFTPERMAAGYLRLYAEAAERAGAPAAVAAGRET